MIYPYKNLVFSGGGILGIAYLGTLKYFYETDLIKNIENIAGTSAGAITSCLTSFNLPYANLHSLLDSLDYTKVADKDDNGDSLANKELRSIPKAIKTQLDKLFDNVDCVYRLINSYGWYSSNYLYQWIKLQIQQQFDPSKKAPPYTFSDFANTDIHLDKHPFKNLFIIGTDISRTTSSVFSYDTTPNMEVAEAVRISMSVPLLFESIPSTCDISPNSTSTSLYVDGGMLYNYPIDLFDATHPQNATLGVYFNRTGNPSSIKNIVDFISCALSCSGSIQNQLFITNHQNLKRSICIQTSDISPFDFNITTGDDTYNFLVSQGYHAAELYFSLLS